MWKETGMIFIAHRGNTEGPSPDYENDPIYLQQALNNLYDIELDVWYLKGKWLLGHDSPQYPLKSTELLMNSHSWCHAKNIGALHELNKMGAHCFWHEEDDYTLTSLGHIWTYPGKTVTDMSIIVIKSFVPLIDVKHAMGICSDNIGHFRDVITAEAFFNSHPL